jgi:DNA-binding MarR family transcriptional regulator
MKTQQLMELSRLFFEYNALYYQKLGVIFREADQQEPHCNKNQKRALFIIDEKLRITPSDLGRCLGLQKATLTSLVDFLVARDLVRREPDRIDRRKIWLTLTVTGKEYIQVKKAAYDGEFARRFTAISEAEIEASMVGLRSVIDLMVKI